MEQLVGLFDVQRSGIQQWSIQDFADASSPRRWTSEELSKIYLMRSQLFARWSATSDPGSLELFFPPALG